MKTQTVTIAREGGVAIVTYDRGGRANAMSFAVMDELAAAALSFVDDTDLRCVVLTGTARIFSAGMDLSDPVFDQINEMSLQDMRHYSERVPGKNYREFAGRPLYRYIVESLLNCSLVDQVCIDTDSPIIVEDAARNFPDVKIIERPENLRADTVPMNDILLYDVSQVEADYYIQTHSTNPLLSAKSISEAIQSFLDSNDVQHAVVVGAGFVGLEVADALVERGVRVTLLQADHGPLNRYLEPEIAALVGEIVVQGGVTGCRQSR